MLGKYKVLIPMEIKLPKCQETGKHRFHTFWHNRQLIRKTKKKGFKKVKVCIFCGKVKDEQTYIYYNKLLLKLFKETLFNYIGGNYEKEITKNYAKVRAVCKPEWPRNRKSIQSKTGEKYNIERNNAKRP